MTSVTPGIKWQDWRVILLASLGGALEFYDFVVYGLFAQYIAAAFFPNDDPLVSLTYSYAGFAIGYLARPLGGIFFSHIGDKLGRRRVLIITILMMTAATFGMGLLPTYAEWGVAASLSMLALRLMQGFCLGGELPGAITYVVETAPQRAGFSVGLIFFCVNSGVLIAALLNLTLQGTLTPADLADWGWRIGFIIGGVLGLVSFWLRLSLEESREFSRIRGVAGAAKIPIAELFRTHLTPVVVGFAVLSVTAGFNGLLFTMPSFLPSVMGYEAPQASLGQNIGLLVLSIGLLTVAYFSDFVSRRAFLMIGTALFVLLSYPFYSALQDHTGNLLLMMVMAGVVASFCNGVVCAICADLFPTRIRFSGVALSFNLSFTIFSGIAPLVATWLVRSTGAPASASFYMIFCALLAFGGALVMKRYDGQILGELALRERAN